jgi:hypothetical protein
MWLTKKDLAVIYKCSPSTIRRWTEELGVSSETYYLSEDILPKLNEFYEKYKLRKNSFKKAETKQTQGKFSKRDLEKYFSKADTTILRYIKTAGLPTSKRFYSIEDFEKIKAVSKLYSRGYTTKEIISGFKNPKAKNRVHTIDVDAVDVPLDIQ